MNNYTYEAELDRVVDGDTVDFVLLLPFNIRLKARLRLAGIDAPESRTRNLDEKAYGLKAKHYVESAILAADKVIIETKKSGKFGRFLSVIFLETNGVTIDMNALMLEKGIATPYYGGRKADWVNRKAILDANAASYATATPAPLV